MSDIGPPRKVEDALAPSVTHRNDSFALPVPFQIVAVKDMSDQFPTQTASLTSCQRSPCILLSGSGLLQRYPICVLATDS